MDISDIRKHNIKKKIDKKYCIREFEKSSRIGATGAKLRNTLTYVLCRFEGKFAYESFGYYSTTKKCFVVTINFDMLHIQNGTITIIRKEICLTSGDSFIRFWIFVNI